MLELILIVYSAIVWLIFIKFKLLPWNMTSKVIVFTLPVIGIVALVLAMNIYTPITQDVRVLNKVTRVAPQVKGRVEKVFVNPEEDVQKGDTLFTIEKYTYELKAEALEMKIAQAEAELSASNHQLGAAKDQAKSLKSQLELAEKRLAQYNELAENNAVSTFTVEQAETQVHSLKAQYEAARANIKNIEAKLFVQYEGEQVSIAQLKNGLAQAQWAVDECTVIAPVNGKVVNLQLRVGEIAAPFKLAAAMSIVEKEQNVVLFFTQNELHQIKRGQMVELTLRTRPGQIITGQVSDIIFAAGEGQYSTNGAMVPQTGAPARMAKYAVKVDVGGEYLEMAARGQGIVYTADPNTFLGHTYNIIRMVMVRLGSIGNYIIPKIH